MASEYKLKGSDLSILSRWQNALEVAQSHTLAMENMMGAYVMNTILPKMGVKRVEGMKIPIDIDIDNKKIIVGIAKPQDPKIVVPNGIAKPR